MENDKDLREAILLVVNACNDYQTRNLALTSALRAAQRNPAKKWDGLSECELQAEILKTYDNAEARVEIEAKEVKLALEGADPFPRCCDNVCGSPLS